MILIEIHQILTEYKISNGCGGKGGVSFSEFFPLLEKLPIFDKVKGEDLLKRVEAHCSIHDLLYTIGGNRRDRLRADMYFIGKISQEISWVRFYIRYTILISLFIGLRRCGSYYFKYDNQNGQKKE